MSFEDLNVEMECALNNNIVFFVNSLDSGGIEHYLLRFLRESSTSFPRIFVYCKSGESGQLEDEYLKIRNVSIVRERISYLNFSSYSGLKEFFIENKIGAVCDFTGNFSGGIMYVASRSKVKTRITFYRNSTNRFKQNPLKNIYNSFMRYLVSTYSSNILANSESAFKFFYPKLYIKDSRFSIINNGINPDEFLKIDNDFREEFSIPKDAFVIGHTGRFNEAKNHKTIIKVAETLVENHKDIYFIMCGNGVHKNLISYLELNGNTDRILTFENLKDIPRFLNTMDCYFFPSSTEGQPNSLIEAMIMGLPYVASNIDPIKDVVFDLNNLYSPYDIDGFVKSLTSIYINKPRRSLVLQDMTIKKFDYKKCFSEFLSKIQG